MFDRPTFRTAYGPSRWEAPQPPVRHRVFLSGREMNTLAGALFDEARDAEQRGEFHLADRLAWRAAELREAAR